MKLLVIGHAQHGKDFFCEIAQKLGYRFISSSIAACEAAVLPVLAPIYGYQTVNQCYEDRGNHRDEWKRLIKEYNTPDLTRLAREILSKNDIYCGMRDRDEFEACRELGLFDLVIWVDAIGRKPPEPPSSMELSALDADIVISNIGTKEQFERRVTRLMRLIKPFEYHGNLPSDWVRVPPELPPLEITRFTVTPKPVQKVRVYRHYCSQCVSTFYRRVQSAVCSGCGTQTFTTKVEVIDGPLLG